MRSASGDHVAFASENATISLSVWRTARSCAATLPPRGFEITFTSRILERDLLGPVGRGIGGDDELELVARVVELEQVLDAARDHRLLVVGGDDHRHRRLDVGLANAARRDAREQGREGGIEDVRPREQHERGPEEDLDDEHRRRS